MLVTFDHNLLIDLEPDNGATDETLRQLVSFHDAGQIAIRVSAISASERLRDKTYAPNFSAFQERIRRLSKREFEILRPLGYWDFTYWDWCIWVVKEHTKMNLNKEYMLCYSLKPSLSGKTMLNSME